MKRSIIICAAMVAVSCKAAHASGCDAHATFFGNVVDASQAEQAPDTFEVAVIGEGGVIEGIGFDIDAVRKRPTR